jgi:hypothetical protein
MQACVLYGVSLITCKMCAVTIVLLGAAEMMTEMMTCAGPPT